MRLLIFLVKNIDKLLAGLVQEAPSRLLHIMVVLKIKIFVLVILLSAR